MADQSVQAINETAAVYSGYVQTNLPIKKSDADTRNVISNTFGQYLKNNLEAIWSAIGLNPNVNIAYQKAMTVQVALTILFLNLGYNIVSLATSHLIAVVVITIITYVRVAHLPFKLDLLPRTFDKGTFYEMLGTGVWFSIGSIGQILLYKVDKFMVGKYISLGMVTSYYITYKLFDLASVFYSNFVNIARPYFSHHYAKNEIKKLSTLYDVFLNSSILILIFGCSFIYLINPIFINWWIPETKEAYLGDTICFLIAVNVIFQSSNLTNRALLASTLFKVKYQGLTRVVEGVLKFIICLLLIESYGISGLLIGSIIACVICSTVTMNYLSNKNLGRGIKNQLKNYIPYTAVSLLIIIYLIPNRIYGGLILISSYLIIALFIWKQMSSEYKENIFSILKKKANKTA